MAPVVRTQQLLNGWVEVGHVLVKSSLQPRARKAAGLKQAQEPPSTRGMWGAVVDVGSASQGSQQGSVSTPLLFSQSPTA